MKKDGLNWCSKHQREHRERSHKSCRYPNDKKDEYAERMSNPRCIEDVLLQCGLGSGDGKNIADAIRLWILQNLPGEGDIFKLLPREWKYGAKKGDLPERIARYTAKRIIAQVKSNLLEGV